MKTIIFNIKQFDISMGYNLNFLSNNVNGLNSSKKRIKIFEYLKKIANNGTLFLQETHSSNELSSTGVAILKVNCFFQMEPQIHVVSLLDN